MTGPEAKPALIRGGRVRQRDSGPGGGGPVVGVLAGASVTVRGTVRPDLRVAH